MPRAPIDRIIRAVQKPTDPIAVAASAIAMPGAHEEPNDRTPRKDGALARVRRMRPVSVFVSVAAITVAALHIAEPAWKIDSIAIALLVGAALPWLGEILDSVQLPGGGGFTYRERVKNVEGRVDELRDILPLLLPPYLMDHLKNLAHHMTRPYYTDQPLINNLRALRNMGLIDVLPGRKSEGKGIGSLANVYEFDLADWVYLTQAGDRWVKKAAELEEPKPRVGH
jgi:hypothetical protein